jgi:hypothetical protein
VLSYSELEAIFLNSNDPIVERIQAMANFDEAYQMAREYLADEKRNWAVGDLMAVVEKFRSM